MAARLLVEQNALAAPRDVYAAGPRPSRPMAEYLVCGCLETCERPSSLLDSPVPCAAASRHPVALTSCWMKMFVVGTSLCITDGEVTPLAQYSLCSLCWCRSRTQLLPPVPEKLPFGLRPHPGRSHHRCKLLKAATQPFEQRRPI